MDSFAGTARFRIVRCLGAGGMGVVYEAQDEERNTRVALKTLRTLTPNALLLFKTEFRALADLHHPNLVSLGELIEHEGQYFFTMELVSGSDLLAWVRPGSTIREDQTTIVDAGDTQPAASDARGSVLGNSSAKDGVLDEGRLRSSLVQLVHGLAALHSAGKVHRDIKPSNILVSPQGRIVMVDFGVVGDLKTSSHSGEGMAGTIAYMAPEQAKHRNVGPEADYYSVGVVLYEALTGQLPYSGSAYEVLQNKAKTSPPSPSSLGHGVAEDLDALCMDLLAIDVAARPNADDILARLGAPPSRPSMPPTSGQVFVGRAREQDELFRAYRDARTTGVTVYVHGETGVGKSALVRKLIDRVSDVGGAVLAGRCYERESVPFKAVDGVVDSLVRILLRYPKSEIATMLPEDAALLGRVFPVLRRIVPTPKEQPPSYEAGERRMRIFAALRAVLFAIAKTTPLVVVIEDLQWADADSIALLREVMRPPDAPALLLVATVRTAEARTGSAAPSSLPASRLNVGSSLMPGDVRNLLVERLARAEAEELARLLIAQTGCKGVTPETVATETLGHPLFIDELIRHAAVASEPASHLRLDDALRERIDIVSAGIATQGVTNEVARRIIEVVCVARSPLPEEVIARAADVDDPAVFDRQVAALRAAHLVRTSSTKDGAVVMPYHDRVRRAVMDRMTDKKALHARIARALEGTNDDEAIAEHLAASGAKTDASVHALRAADRANELLAFERAARLYRWASELGEVPDGTTLKLADALANAGKTREAAEAYLALSRDTEDVKLELAAARQLFLSGQIDRGLSTLREVLQRLDVPPAGSPRATAAALIVRRARLRLRGLRFERKPADAVAAARVDACFLLGMALGLVDPLRGEDFQSRGLALALRLGDPARIARGLALEGAYVALRGERTRPRFQALFDRARTVAGESDDPVALGFVVAAEGAACAFSGMFAEARERLSQGDTLLRRTDATWEIDVTSSLLVRTLLACGDVKRMAAELSRRLAESDARGNVLACSSMRTGGANLAWLFRGDAQGARDVLDHASAAWKAEGLDVFRAQEIEARVNIALYEGAAAEAHERLMRIDAELRRALSPRLRSASIGLCDLRARCAIALGKSRASSSELLDAATRDANDIARSGEPWARATATLLRGSIAAARSQRERAIASFDNAQLELEACNMHLLAHVARFRRGEVAGTESREARAFMEREGIADPARIAHLFAP